MKRHTRTDEQGYPKPGIITPMPKKPTRCVSFIKINCPNCNDKRYESRGGYEDHGPYAHAMPSCRVCEAMKTLILCYGCNKIGKDRANQCSECSVSFECEHVWIEDNGIFKCKYCLKTGIPRSETVECLHKFMMKNGEVSCRFCNTKGKIDC